MLYPCGIHDSDLLPGGPGDPCDYPLRFAPPPPPIPEEPPPTEEPPADPPPDEGTP